MADTKTDIANLALNFLGDETEIEDIDDLTDTDMKTVLCRRHYPSALKKTLRETNPPFARVFADLTLLFSDYEEGWAYAYHYPSDCLNLLRIKSGVEPNDDTNQTPVPYRIISKKSGTAVNVTNVTSASEAVVTAAAHGLLDGDLVLLDAIEGPDELNENTYLVSDKTTNTFKIKDPETGDYIDTTGYTAYDTGGTATRAASKIILCNESDARAEYTYLCEDVTIYPSDYVDLLGYCLAGRIAIPVVGKDRSEIAVQMRQAYVAAKMDTRAAAWKEQQPEQKPVSKYQSGRN